MTASSFLIKRQRSDEMNENEGNCEELKRLKAKEKRDVEAVQKDQWGNDIEFLLSCITLSVGLGNVWR